MQERRRPPAWVPAVHHCAVPVLAACVSCWQPGLPEHALREGQPTITVLDFDPTPLSSNGTQARSVSWSSDRDARYEIRVGDCGSGALSTGAGATGTAEADSAVTSMIIIADLEAGSNSVSICVDRGGGIVSETLTLVRDDDAPQLVVTSPQAGDAETPRDARDPLSVTVSEALVAAPQGNVATATWNGTAFSEISLVAAGLYDAETRVWSFPLRTGLWPENARIRITLTPTSGEDVAGNPITLTPIVWEFYTGITSDVPPMPDTGQETCYDTNGATLACADSGQDGAFDTPNDRNVSLPIDSETEGQQVTTDAVTSLIWRSCVLGTSGDTCQSGTATALSWIDALDACAELDELNAGAGLAESVGWRLPTLAEALTIPDYAKSTPLQVFPGAAVGFWTATGEAQTQASALVIESNTSVGTRSVTATDARTGVRCVAGGDSVLARSLDTASEAGVAINEQGLAFQRCSAGQSSANGGCTGTAARYTWSDALAICNAVAPVTSWRLPSLNELKTLVRADLEQGIDSSVFECPTTACDDAPFWSSTTSTDSPGMAWRLDFAPLTLAKASKRATAYVRCVAAP